MITPSTDLKFDPALKGKHKFNNYLRNYWLLIGKSSDGPLVARVSIAVCAGLCYFLARPAERSEVRAALGIWVTESTEEVWGTLPSLAGHQAPASFGS